MSEKRERKFNKKTLYGIGGAILVLILIYFAFFRGSNQNQDEYIKATVERGDLIATIGGTGKVEANKTALLSWKTSGSVMDVHAFIGDEVAAGEDLAELDPVSLPQNVILANADLVEAKRNLETVLESETKNSQVYINLLDAEESFDEAEEDMENWNYNNADQVEIDEARLSFIKAEESLKTAEEALQSAVENNVTEEELEELQLKVDEAQDERDTAIRKISNLLGKSYDKQVADDFAAYDLAKAQLEDAQREWERVKDGPNQDDIIAAEARVIAAQSVADMARIHAPFAGTVTAVTTKIGDEVNAGSSAFRVDDLSAFYVEVEIPEVDIHRIEVGQEAEFVFDSLVDKRYSGEVVEVSGAGTEIQGETNFMINLLMKDSDEDIIPGMTASVNIVVSKLEDVLIVPNRAIRLENGDVLVYILNDGVLEKVEVDIGSSSENYTQILSGDIQEGDVLVLNPPQEFSSSDGPPAFVR